MSKLAQAVRGVPRTVIGTTLSAARLPLNTLERVTGHRGDDEWPPTMVFETAEATVETALGGLIRDDELVRRGHLRRTRLAKLREAAALDGVADVERAQADDELRARRERVEQRRDSVEQAAEARERQVEKQATQRKQRVRKQTAARKRDARKQTAATRKAVDRRERAGRLSAAKAEEKAVRAERAALAAEDRALADDKALQRARKRQSS